MSVLLVQEELVPMVQEELGVGTRSCSERSCDLAKRRTDTIIFLSLREYAPTLIPIHLVIRCSACATHIPAQHNLFVDV